MAVTLNWGPVSFVLQPGDQSLPEVALGLEKAVNRSGGHTT